MSTPRRPIPAFEAQKSIAALLNNVVLGMRQKYLAEQRGDLVASG
ncbi:MAG: hypothetical protein NZM37_11135 [Sandaracinaceae bacterium]|nr:hypothetical protein [Sandaracinaceae bacterium]MDW8246920.1 hypothetical protein [Sandaracinaceae bacterium]